MPTNEILPFCPTDTGTNLLTQVEYAADSNRTNGVQPGIARSKLNNKAIRQASFVAAAVAQNIVNATGQDVLDDGDLNTLIANLAATWGNVDGPATPTTANGLVVFADITGEEIAQATGTGYVKVASGVVGTPSATIPHTDITGLGTAATAAVGTSGATLGLLNANKTDSGTNTFSGVNTFSSRIDTPNIRATTSGGVLLEANSGTDIALLGSGGGAGSTFYGQINAQAGINPNASGGSVFANYEVGTFTPTMIASVTPGTPTYVSQAGWYMRFGNWVACVGRVITSGWAGSPAGEVRIGSLPFTAANDAGNRGLFCATFYAGLALPAGTVLSGYVDPNNNYVRLSNAGNTNSSDFTDITEYTTDGAEIYFVTFFRTA